ncbi:hypothetical protein [Vulcanisaeta thermophila]|uniref:hypothetical protein n=1 Tax=Vulcanisaeta thermophila TaxID=867917 RepID=UPI0013897485|nr:hypothetical protein [Vulcanisaeta thermophila]
MKDFVKRLVDAASEALGTAQLKLATLAIDFVRYALERRKGRVAVLVDDAF